LADDAVTDGAAGRGDWANAVPKVMAPASSQPARDARGGRSRLEMRMDMAGLGVQDDPSL
jgi:hypothetical protein